MLETDLHSTLARSASYKSRRETECRGKVFLGLRRELYYVALMGRRAISVVFGSIKLHAVKYSGLSFPFHPPRSPPLKHIASDSVVQGGGYDGRRI